MVDLRFYLIVFPFGGNQVHCFCLDPGMGEEYLKCIVLAQIAELGGSISTACLLVTRSLINLVDECPFKEMKMQSQSKVYFFVLCLV